MGVSLDNKRLLDFNQSIVEQAQSVIKALETHDATDQHPVEFGEYVGPHLRHILEHYEALVAGGDSGSAVDYDARQRDRTLEQDSQQMSARFKALSSAIAAWNLQSMQRAVSIHLQGGLCGEFDFVTQSSIGREMLFLASHATHHYALIQVYCLKRGISLGADFGKAPSTVAYERT